ncbi:hypothetical protein U0070_012113, partial [Myodes glareolus]
MEGPMEAPPTSLPPRPYEPRTVASAQASAASVATMRLGMSTRSARSEEGSEVFLEGP